MDSAIYRKAGNSGFAHILCPQNWKIGACALPLLHISFTIFEGQSFHHKHLNLKRLAARGEMKKAFGLAKYHGDYKGLDYAIAKGTNYDHALPKDKHIRRFRIADRNSCCGLNIAVAVHRDEINAIFQSLSPSKPRTEVIYCINGLARRLNHTNNWAVALKALIIIHRAMRELDNTVWEELVHYSKGRGYLIEVSNFHDTSIPNALDYSAWIRNYGIYLEERLRCYIVFNHDVATYSPKHSQKLDTEDLLEQLPPLQVLLSTLLDCKPGGAAAYNRLIQYALSIVAGESVKLYVAITVRVVELLDKFFEMNHNDAASALKIYQKSGSQAERLSEFFETCRGLEFGRGQKFITIKQPPASFMTTMEEYIKDTPCTLMLEYNVSAEDKGATGNEDTACLADLLSTEDAEKSDPSPENNEAAAPSQAAHLMGLYDLLTGASEFEENSLALAIVPPTEKSIDSSNDENGVSPVTTGWEVALFTEAAAESSSNENAVVSAESKEITIFEKQSGELDVSKLDSLYNEAMNGGASAGYNIGQVNDANANANPFDFQASQYNNNNNMAVAPPNIQSAFYGSPNMASPIPVGMTYQDYYIMHHQQQDPLMNNNNNMIQKTTNPFDEPNIVLPPASAVPEHPTQTI